MCEHLRIGFDFSGTLANDAPPVYAASRKVVEELGGVMPPFDIWMESGCANMGEFIAKFQIPVALDEFSERTRAAWRANASAAVAYEGITELLVRLKKAGHSLFLISCCWQDILDKEVHELGWCGIFEKVIGSLVDKRETIAELKLQLYVGDTLGDLRACEGLARFIAVGYGYGKGKHFATAGVEHVLACPLELSLALEIECGKVLV